ncbi:probable insulin-like peptide 1 [Drosophila grimshawi]|uniref:GH15431 n=1 Tax=Drosophila grimshawi TaxID=7222 RepID=B4J2N9_DROGR|nr:probable insulin-like peptide 1 [Drosophila grimshawi]EDV96030.1 GH15431 [Drosophila grimshawi]
MFIKSASLYGRQLVLLLALLIAIMGSGCYADGIGGFRAASMTHPLREGKHKLCGPALNEAMSMVCVNGYNTIPKKRMDSNQASLVDVVGVVAAEQTQLQQPRGSDDGYALSPLLSSIYGTEVLIKTRRLRRQRAGIYDECCVNSCSYPELLAYCRS